MVSRLLQAILQVALFPIRVAIDMVIRVTFGAAMMLTLIFGVTLACSLWFPVTRGLSAIVLLACGEPVDYNPVEDFLSFWR